MAMRHGFEEFKASYRHCFNGLTVAHFALQSLTLAISPRGVVDALHYRALTGCQWRQLPKDFPPYSTVEGSLCHRVQNENSNDTTGAPEAKWWATRTGAFCRSARSVRAGAYELGLRRTMRSCTGLPSAPRGT